MIIWLHSFLSHTFLFALANTARCSRIVSSDDDDLTRSGFDNYCQWHRFRYSYVLSCRNMWHGMRYFKRISGSDLHGGSRTHAFVHIQIKNTRGAIFICGWLVSSIYFLPRPVLTWRHDLKSDSSAEIKLPFEFTFLYWILAVHINRYDNCCYNTNVSSFILTNAFDPIFRLDTRSILQCKTALSSSGSWY